MRSRWFIVTGIVVLVVISILSIGISTAQQSLIPVQGGSVIIGNIPADGTQAVYTFTGNVGDIVTVRVVGLTPGMDPNVAVVSPSQQLVVASDIEPLNPNPAVARVVERLPETGNFFIVVSGTAGDFVMTVETRPAPVVVNLNLDVPADLTLPFNDNLPRVFTFNTDPFTATTLHLDAEPFTLTAFIEVRDGSGQLVAFLQGDLDNACVSMAPGDEVREVTVSSFPGNTGTVRLTLSNAPCVLGPAPVELPIVPVQIQPIVINGVCAATSARTVNIRSGPGLNFPIIGFLFASRTIQVIGVSDGNRWFLVQNNFLQGWVASSVVAITGPCTALPLVPAPAAPQVLPTAGVPVMTVTPFVITGTPMPTQTPFIIVITPMPGATVTSAVPTPTTGGALTATPVAPTPIAPTVTLAATVAPTVTQITLATTLTGAAEVLADGTPNQGDPDGTGSANITLDMGQGQVCFEIGVSGITLPATEAHIHAAPSNTTGSVVVGLTPPDANGVSSGCASATPELIKGIGDNPQAYYVNVHTTDYPDGALRGQLAK